MIEQVTWLFDVLDIHVVVCSLITVLRRDNNYNSDLKNRLKHIRSGQ